MRPLLLPFAPLLPLLTWALPACSEADRGPGGVDEDTAGPGDSGQGADSGAGHGDGARVVLNEVLASNEGVVSDGHGDADDFIELYTAGSVTAEIGGWHLSDDPGKIGWAAPEGTIIAPGGMLLIWCDGQPDQGVLHAAFKLSADGESVLLWDDHGQELWSEAFGPQAPDVSYGRAPDGSEHWTTFAAPTPGASNGE